MTDDLLRDDARTREAFRKGERWALNEVYRVYFPVVHIVVSQGSGNFRGFFNAADREDAIQNVFAAAFEEKARLSYNGLDAYKSFIRGVAQNTCRRMLEKRARFKRTDWDPNPGLDANKTVEDDVIEKEAQALMRRFRDNIDDPVERDVLQRYFVDGEAEESIAKETRMTRYRIRKTIAKLQKNMQRYVMDHGLA